MNPTLKTDEKGLVKTGDYTAVNPLYATPQALAQAAKIQWQPITSSSLANNQNPLTLPETTGATSQTAGASVQGITEGLNQSSLASIQQEQDLKAQQAKAQADSQTSKIQGYIDKLMGKGQAQVQAEEQAGISQKTQELTNITNEYNTKALEYRRMEEAVMKEGTLTDVQKNARLREISRVKNTELADIGIRQAVAQNNLKTAQDLVDRKIDLEYGDLKDIIGFQTQFLEMNREDLSKAEQNALNLRITENQRKYDEGLKIGEFAKSVAANGADAATITRVTNAKTMAEAIQAAGSFAGDVTERLYKQEQLNNARLQGQKLAQEIEAGKPLTGEFAGVINSAAGLVPATKRSTTKSNIASAIASENYTTAYAEIANAVSDGLTGTNKTTFDDARTDINVMMGMRNAIKEYTDAGGDIGFLKGTADQIAKKFGQLAVDPKFATLGTQLQREFQMYRLGMTGAAFSPEESREYAMVNPRTNATLDLNLATIDGALNQLTNRVVSTVNARIPEAQKIYDLAFTKSDMSEAQTPVGDTQYVGGVKYIKAQDGLYYPENQQQPQHATTFQSTTPSINPSYQSLNNTNAFSGLGSFFNFK